MKYILLFGVVLAFGPAASAAEDWPQFRGPTGQGVVAGSLPVEWQEDVNLKWKTKIYGRGWSSPIVANGRIWLTTAEEHAADEAKRQALLKSVEKLPVAEQMVAFESVTLAALELDLATGKLLRRIELFRVDTPPPIHGLNSYASPTPVIAGGRVFCHFGTFGAAAINADSGEVLWRKQFKLNHVVGPGSSPVVCGDVLVVPCDGADKQFVLGLNVATGDIVWKKDRPPIRSKDPEHQKAFCTPLAIEVNGRKEVVIPGAQWFVAYDPASGEEIWRLDHGPGFSNVARPVFDGKVLYLCTGFGKPQLWAVKADGAGELDDSAVLWKQKQQIGAKPSPAVSGGRVYEISDTGVASCLDAATGKVLWRERMPGNYSASPTVGNGRVYFMSQEGRTTVIRDAATYEVLSKNDVDGMQMASLAAAGGDVILRTDTHLYRFGNKDDVAGDGGK
jgi:outer membrane protein assembly factor BamB